eukprot:5397232-Pyramimonas_sp.AAC.1
MWVETKKIGEPRPAWSFAALARWGPSTLRSLGISALAAAIAMRAATSPELSRGPCPARDLRRTQSQRVSPRPPPTSA